MGWPAAVIVFSTLVAFSVRLIICYLSPNAKIYIPLSVGKSNLNHSHIWIEGDIPFGAGEGPSYCNHCSELVLHGMICIVCGNCAHKDHLGLVTFANKCKHAIRDDIEDGIMAKTHQWAEGNLPLDATCDFCKKVAGDAPQLDGFRCLGCLICVHKECLEKTSNSPCLPNRLSMKGVVDPYDLINTANSLRRTLSEPSKFGYKPFSKQSIAFSPSPENTSGSPLLCFINPKSGTQNSLLLLKSLYSLLNPCQILDVSRRNPADLFKIFKSHLHQCRIIVCGGDGTVGWILSELDNFITSHNLEKAQDFRRPPVAILPLGTGNDLARVLNWGSGWTGESVDEILNAVLNAEMVKLDRWRVQINAIAPTSIPSTNIMQKALVFSESIRKKPPLKEIIMNNYLSIGVDASIALDFHTKREKTPHLFKSRTINKGWYALFGGKRMFSNLLSRIGSASSVNSSAEHLNTAISSSIESIISSNESEEILGDTNQTEPTVIGPPLHSPLMGSTVHMDTLSKPFNLDDTGAVILLNIPSYAGGSQIHANSQQSSVLIDDQKIQVLQVSSSLELAASIVHLTSPKVLGNCEKVEFLIAAPEIDIQVDGEPWIQKGPCAIQISFFSNATMMKKADSG